MNLEAIGAAIRNVPDFPKPGIQFKDITPLLQHPDLCKEIVDGLVERWKTEGIDAVVGIESRGFLFGMALAQGLNVPFVPLRKPGKLPAATFSYAYDLEYGQAEVEIHQDALEPGQRVLIHDDLLATGGTAEAAAELVRKCKAEVAGFTFIIGLSFLSGEKRLEKYDAQIESILSY